MNFVADESVDRPIVKHPRSFAVITPGMLRIRRISEQVFDR